MVLIFYTEVYYCLSEYRVEIDIIRAWLAEPVEALTHTTCMVTALIMLGLLPLALRHVSFVWCCHYEGWEKWDVTFIRWEYFVKIYVLHTVQ